jgi:hypothetical protein
VSHLIYNKILINFLKEKKIKNKRKLKKKKLGGRQTHKGWPATPFEKPPQTSHPHGPWGGSATPKGQKKKKKKNQI